MRYIILILILVLTGCSAKEPENRDFVMIMGISKSDNYKVSTAVSKLGDENNSLIVYNTEGDTINNAVNKLNTITSGELFLGDVQAILTDNNIEQEISELINNNMEIGRDIPVIMCRDIDKIISYNNEKISLQDYITQYFKNYDNKKINIETYLNSSENNKNLPVLKLSSNNYIIE